MAHPLIPMVGRDPRERGRASSPLELLFDLTFVVAVGTAASEFAEMLAAGHTGAACTAFVLAMFAICLAWISYTWFASAFGNDDWLHRILTMLQMIGVVIFALGLPPMFRSVEEGEQLELRVMVIGYVVMRVAMTLQWWRAARGSQSFHDVGITNIRWTVIAQAGWVVVGFTQPPLTIVLVAFAVLAALELVVPAIAQGRAGGTPWHPHHLAERYSLFAIITLGEGVVGTVASSAGLLGGPGGMDWNVSTVAVVVAGVGMTFGLWWVYFATPFGEILAYRRRRGYLFGYGHMLLFVGVAGTGAGLHVAGLQLEHHAETGPVATVLAVAAPVGLYLLMVYLLHTLLLSAPDPFHLLLISITLAVLVAAVALAAVGVGVALCLLVVTLAPFVTVVGYETIGHRHQQRMLDNLHSSRSGR